MAKLVAPHCGKLAPVLFPVPQQTESLVKTKTIPMIRRTFIRATVAAYHVTSHHGCIVPAYQRPSFIW